MNYNNKPQKVRPYTKIRIAAYALSFFMAVTPLVGYASDVKAAQDTVKPETTQTQYIPKRVMYKGIEYPPCALEFEGIYSAHDGKYTKAMEIYKILNDKGFYDEAFGLLESLVDILNYDEKVRKDIHLLYAQECEKRELYEAAGKTYGILDMKDKKDECFKKATNQYLQKMKDLKQKKEGKR